jgi:hypothetical protein
MSDVLVTYTIVCWDTILLEGRASGTPEAIKKIIPIISVIVLQCLYVLFL